MKITIAGSPKEIAALALKMQGQQEEQAHKITIDSKEIARVAGNFMQPKVHSTKSCAPDVAIHIDLSEVDAAIKKASQLDDALAKANNLIGSLHDVNIKITSD
ncbi:hypothetical protein [Caproicibacterium amylolyticum]|uniref:Uncharacterized protein n=1 Tax=Caproicibacterium amylolyticum TaxID=2766537 RepID=A0A7G9WJI2_9FIRM|nr:hypothetical protein [Caproicibacterium amylolyticum]QNO18844.1 hypothetical protein H6X83_04200 [Caproicibacterium amylolyticum]